MPIQDEPIPTNEAAKAHVTAILVKIEASLLDASGKVASRGYSQEVPIFEADFPAIQTFVDFLKSRGQWIKEN